MNLWKDGIIFMLKLAKEASQQGEKEVALSLLVTSLAAETMLE